MDIAALSSSMALANVKNDFGVAMLSKSLDQNQDAGAQLAEMIDASQMELSVNPSVGGNFDFRV